jgi:long-subunit fatty acid transport protein
MSKTEHFTTIHVRRSARCLLAAVALFTFPLSAFAQTSDVLTSPPNIVVPNYEGIPVGPFAGLEASAYVARTDDPSAAWFNPAGLSRAKGAQISGSAGLYQYTKLSPSIYPGAGSSVEHVPNLVGFTMQKGQLTGGVAILTPVSWSQTTNLEIFAPSGQNLERFSFNADSDFYRRVIAASVGYDSKKNWRIGGGLTFMYTSLKMAQTISDRIAEPTGLRTLLVSSIIRGSDTKIGAVGGIQADFKTHIRVGAVLRTSGFSIYRSGTATLDGTDKNGAASEGASLFDPSAEFHYKIPFEITGAIAWVGTRGEVETAVHGYTSVSPYSLISSPVQAILYHDDGLGGPPTFTQQPFAGLTSASRSIANVSVGGHYKLYADRELRLHFGVTTDMSPVAPEDQVFDKVDLVAWTVGLSGRINKLTYAAGFNYRSGTSDSITVRNLISRQPVTTDIGIRTMGMIYSVSYQF